jgi:cell division protein YceG involved in septum cleavage
MNKKKSHKHSNEELFNHKFHKKNGNIFRFQPKIEKYQTVILISLIERETTCIINRERERD